LLNPLPASPPAKEERRVGDLPGPVGNRPLESPVSHSTLHNRSASRGRRREKQILTDLRRRESTVLLRFFVVLQVTASPAVQKGRGEEVDLGRLL